MIGDEKPNVLGIIGLVGTEVIDGGDTVAVRLKQADGREIALLVPRKVAGDLLGELIGRLAEDQGRRPKR